MDKKLLLGPNTTYGFRSIADDSTDLYGPIHINDYMWTNVGKPYSREEYMKHSLCVDPWTPQYQQEPCYDDSSTQKRRKKDEIMDRLSILQTFLKDKENKDMLGKSVDVKKVIY